MEVEPDQVPITTEPGKSLLLLHRATHVLLTAGPRRLQGENTAEEDRVPRHRRARRIYAVHSSCSNERRIAQPWVLIDVEICRMQVAWRDAHEIKEVTYAER